MTSRQTAPLSLAKLVNEVTRGEESFILEAANVLELAGDFATSAAYTLSLNPKRLESKFLYDSRGSELFDLICEQPEYYLTRAEASILKASAKQISEIVGPASLVELGSGSSVKTNHILSAFTDHYKYARYVPIDVSRAALEQACDSIASQHEQVTFTGINGSFECAFPLLSHITPVMVMFLGSSIGNFDEDTEHVFWKSMSQCLNTGDYFLLGVDLVKDTETLEAAYNDKAGVTAAFTKNLFARMNREFKSDIDVDSVEHRARYSEERERVEICAHFTKAQVIKVKPVGKSFEVDENEKIHTEISRKYRLDKLVPYLSGFGFKAELVLTDSNKHFALLLLRRLGE